MESEKGTALHVEWLATVSLLALEAALPPVRPAPPHTVVCESLRRLWGGFGGPWVKAS